MAVLVCLPRGLPRLLPTRLRRVGAQQLHGGGSDGWLSTRQDHADWLRKVVRSRKPRPPAAAEVDGSVAPFLQSVEPLAHRLRYFACREGTVGATTPSASCIEVVWPVSSDEKVHHQVADLTLHRAPWSAFRLSKFYEALDALTGDVAKRHIDALGGENVGRVTVVTAGHYHSHKLARTEPRVDVHLRSYVTAVGSASLEVRTDGLQVGADGRERLLSVCHTVMVAMCAESLRPLKGALPPLAEADDEPTVRADGPDEPRLTAQRVRAELAAAHKALRLRRAQQTMSLHRDRAISHPPCPDEMASVHELHRAATRLSESDEMSRRAAIRPDAVSSHTHSSSFVIYPEQRNLNGKAFGGFVASTAFDLAYFAARYFARDAPVVPIGLDEAVFHTPVAVGDMVTMTACVVHCAAPAAHDGAPAPTDAEGGELSPPAATPPVTSAVSSPFIFRVEVTAGVLDNSDQARSALRTNRLRFAFAAHPAAWREVLPETYPQLLAHVDAARRHAIETPSADAMAQLGAFFREQGDFEHVATALRAAEYVRGPRPR